MGGLVVDTNEGLRIISPPLIAPRCSRIMSVADEASISNSDAASYFRRVMHRQVNLNSFPFSYQSRYLEPTIVFLNGVTES